MKEECNQLRISKKKLESIFMPIGLDIKSETPFEIAISIAAQLISIKNKSQYSFSNYINALTL